MPGLQFTDLPAEQTKKIKDQLHAQWQIEANALNRSWFSDRGKFNTAKAKLNSKYQQLELNAFTKLQQQVQEQQRVQQLIRQPRERTREQEAQLRMELRPEAERLVFPTETEPRPFTPQQAVSLSKNIQKLAEGAKQEPFYKWGAKKTRKSLIDRYATLIKIVGTQDPDVFGPDKRKHLNDIWNEVMRSDPQFSNWFDEQDKPPIDMRIAASTGKIADAMREKVMPKSPIGQSLLGALVKGTYGTGKEMRERYGLKPREKLTVQPPQKPAAQPRQEPIRQRNRRTGQERISYDGGKTWQMTG